MQILFIRRRRRAAAQLSVLCVLLLSACASRGGDALREGWNPDAISDVKGVGVDKLRPAIAQRLEGPPPEGITRAQWHRTNALYEAHGGGPLFLERNGAGARVRALVEAIGEAHEHAIEPGRYALAELEAALRPLRDRRPPLEDLVHADVLMTAVYAAFGDDLLTGQIDPRSVNPDWRINPRSVDVDSTLARTLRFEPLDRAIAQLRPQSSGYRALEPQLARYRELVDAGGWGAVPRGETLAPGDTSAVERLMALRDRLRIEGYLGDVALQPVADDTARAVYDRTLAGAVARFQARHAIVVDSILGPETVESLNVTAEYRLGQIASSLERYRWLPRELGSRYVYVNVPAFRLDAYEDGEPVLSMRVIVGSEYRDRATPSFADSMSYIEFAPYWNVPERLADEDIWPKVHADPGYLGRNNYETWQDGETTRIRQRPGRQNALGLVKFMFPNQFDIYLHDTPQQELFERDVRTFSAGCIRVEKPDELAEYVLRGQGDWTLPRIQQAMEGENRRVDLDRKLPVYIVYFTAYVQDGELHFGNDVYDRDGPLVSAVAGAARPKAESLQAVAALRNQTRGNLLSRLFARLG